MFIGFVPNVVLRFALMSRFSVPNFSPMRARIHVLWRIFQTVRKEEEKNEKKTLTSAARISEMAGVIFFKLGMWTSLPSRHFYSNFSFNRGITELQRCENRVYFLPVNILTVWRAGFLSRTIHYRVLIL